MSNAIIRNYSEIKTKVEKSIVERSQITNSRGNVVVPRKYHLTETQLSNGRERWLSSLNDVSPSILDKVGDEWFNPYRRNGGYYGSIQALFLLGANEWHVFGKVLSMMTEDMSSRTSISSKSNNWEVFSKRCGRPGAAVTKDLMGRITNNFRTLQRLGGIHPYGLKLQQLKSSIDIYRYENGIYKFKLNTGFDSMESVKPFFDASSYLNGPKKGPKVIEVNRVVSDDTV